MLTLDSTTKPSAAAPDTGVPALSIITTCKGRLDHLKQSLPRMVAQAGAEVIVVDYDCPDCTGDWVAENFPAARVVRALHAPTFNISRARNLGAAQSRGRWLCFVDADVLLDDRFIFRMQPLLREGAFYSIAREPAGLAVSFICDRRDFEVVAGYDEEFNGWGAQDRDLSLRLQRLRRAHHRLQDDLAGRIARNDEDRGRFYKIKNRSIGRRIDALYGQIRNDLSLQLRCLTPPPEMRREIYRQVETSISDAAESSARSCRVDVNFAPNTAPIIGLGWQISRVWSYFVEWPES